MQLLDSRPNQIRSAGSDRLLESLQDIVSNIEIQSNFCISHPAYKPLELPTEIVNRFEKISVELQSKYLSLQLQNFLYGIYYNGSLKTVLAPDADSDDLALHQNLENNTFLGVDLEFYDRLHQSNCGQGYFDPDWLVLRQEDDDSLAVTKNGLTLHIDRQQHLQAKERSAVVGDSVAIRMPRNLVQNGFYMAVGNAGADNRHNRELHSEIVRIYFNVSSEGAVALMKAITRGLNKIKLPFAFKVLYNPSDYNRYDSGVLYFERSHYEAVRSVLSGIYAEERSQFRAETPLFTKLLAPGLALAEEPKQKFATVESFGMNRCQIIVNGLLEARATGDESSEGRLRAILHHFSLLGIDLKHPYLNANSEDIYTSLKL